MLYRRLLSWFFIVFVISTAWLLRYIEDFNLAFLIFLLINLIVPFVWGNKFSKNIVVVSRLLAGALFIFSGFVKGVDPIGTMYRIEDYFIAYNAEWAMPLAIVLSFFLNAFEFVVGGILLMLNVKIKTISWLVVLMMAFFTLTTLYDALYNPVPDCGCFGDAIKLSNWQTLYKNLIINVFVFIIFFSRNKTKSLMNARAEWLMILIASFLFVSFETYNYRHLPIMDYRGWKIGERVIPKNILPSNYYVTYKNKDTQELKEYLSPNYPYNDSTWIANWEFVSQRIEDPNLGNGNDVVIIDDQANDLTSQYLQNPDFQFLLVAYDLKLSNMDIIENVKQFSAKCYTNDISFVILCSNTLDEISEYKERCQLEVEIYSCDDTALKAVIRSNPGLVLLRDAVVIDKWHYNDFPVFKNMKVEIDNN